MKRSIVMTLLMASLCLATIIPSSGQTFRGRGKFGGRGGIGGNSFDLPGLAYDGNRKLPADYTTWAPPAKGFTYIDGTTGTTVKRLSDGQGDFGASGSVLHDLTSTNAFNHTETMLLLFTGAGEGHVASVPNPFNSNTQPSTVVDKTTLGINLNFEPKWSANSNEIYYTPLNSNQLKKAVISQGSAVHSVVHTFTGYTDINLGEGEGDFSEDGTKLPISASKGDGVEDVFVYKVDTDEVGPVLKVAEIVVGEITAISGTTLTLGSYQNGYDWSSLQTSGGRSKMKIFLAGTPNTVRGYAQISSKPATNQVTVSAVPSGTAVGDKFGLVKSFDQVYMTPDNRVLVGYYQPNSSGTVTHDATGTQLYDQGMNRMQLNPPIRALYHGDVGRWTDGAEYHFQEADSDYAPATAQGAGAQMQNLLTGAKTAIRSMPYGSTKYPNRPSSGITDFIAMSTIDNGFADYGTAPNLKGRTATLSSVSGLASDWNSDSRWQSECWNEIYLRAGGVDYHLAFHYSRLDTGRYYGVGHAHLSPLGTFIIWRSNWNTQPVFDFTDVFGVQLRPLTTDFTNPTFSGVTATSITTTSATILATTSEEGTSQVEYGTTTFYSGGVSAFSTTLTTSHSINLTGLSPNTTYHYRVKSRDAAGNIGLSADSTFTTAP